MQRHTDTSRPVGACLTAAMYFVYLYLVVPLHPKMENNRFFKDNKKLPVQD